MSWSRKWLVYLSARKTKLVLFDLSSNPGAADIKMDGFVPEGKAFF